LYYTSALLEYSGSAGASKEDRRTLAEMEMPNNPCNFKKKYTPPSPIEQRRAM